MIADDPILGRVRLCSGCDEWWPDDAEFFYIPLGSYNPKRQCRACIIEKRHVYGEKRRWQDRVRWATRRRARKTAA